MAERAELLEAIRQAEETIARLEVEREAVRARLERLRAELLAIEAAGSPIARPPTPSAGPQSPLEKVRLFRQLFRGRGDVYPVRFESARTGKAGYTPACANRFVRGVCDLPRVKCGECPNQAFLPVDDAAVLGHLQGRHVMGVYPLLQDETCWLLALDLDGGSWRLDAQAFVETCTAEGLRCVVELSRSGDGAHVWFFFAEPLSAALARRMGCALITETAGRRHQLGMASYDRLFPSQDTMPRGGFGNLIALPLQRDARRRGSTIFLDDRLEPIPADLQWAHLAAAGRITRSAVERLVSRALQSGSVVGVRRMDPPDPEDELPWQRPPSRPSAPARLAGPVPAEVRAVLSQRVFVPLAGLSSPLVNAIKRVAAFENPEFYKRQKMRLSTALTPRIISCAEEDGAHVALPRGCRADLEALLRGQGVSVVVEDRRNGGEPLEVEFRGELTPIQAQASNSLFDHDIGVFVAPPGVGKTVVAIHLIAQRRRSTLVLVHRRPLLDQWRAQLALFLGVDQKEIGQVGAGRQRSNGRLDVGMIQSLVRAGKVSDELARYGQIVVDECHHVPAASFERVLSEAKARYLVGLTATPRRRDGLDPIIEMQVGPVRFRVDPRSDAARRPFARRLIVRNTTFRDDLNDGSPAIHEIYAKLAFDGARNEMILDDVIAALEEGRSPIVLTERRDHLDLLADRLRPFCRQLVLLHGGLSARERRTATERLTTIPFDQERLVLATGRYIGEGFDDARLDTLFLAMPFSWRGTVVQYAGRLHRLLPGKDEVRIYDYVDREVALLNRMFEKRLRGYRAIGYASHDEEEVFDRS